MCMGLLFGEAARSFTIYRFSFGSDKYVNLPSQFRSIPGFNSDIRPVSYKITWIFWMMFFSINILVRLELLPQCIYIQNLNAARNVIIGQSSTSGNLIIIIIIVRYLSK